MIGYSGNHPTVRDQLAAIGMGQFNITMCVPYMMISPATSDPKANQTILILQHIQRALYALGATDVPESGRLDPATVSALQSVVGPGWEGMPWSSSVKAIIHANQQGMGLSPMAPDMEVPPEVPVAVGGPLDFLPDIPGGIFTYALGGYLLYRHFVRKRAS